MTDKEAARLEYFRGRHTPVSRGELDELRMRCAPPAQYSPPDYGVSPTELADKLAWYAVLVRELERRVSYTEHFVTRWTCDFRKEG